MASANPVSRDFPSDDELDAILNGDLDVGDISATIQNQDHQSTQKQQISAATTAALGVDTAIEVDQVKKRLPIPKLDDARLLSAAGIPKLQRISKERLRFKGKGHEYGDVARMLNMYQLWLDDLYPRAKFADGLAMIEKLGHSKRIQYMRKEWINGGKPRTAESDLEDNDMVVPDKTVEQNAELMEGVEVETTAHEKEAQIAKENDIPRKTTETTRVPEDDFDQDELDALLAEAENEAPNGVLTSAAIRPKISIPEENFEDDMEAMAEMEGMW